MHLIIDITHSCFHPEAGVKVNHGTTAQSDKATLPPTVGISFGNTNHKTSRGFKREQNQKLGTQDLRQLSHGRLAEFPSSEGKKVNKRDYFDHPKKINELDRRGKLPGMTFQKKFQGGYKVTPLIGSSILVLHDLQYSSSSHLISVLY